VTERRIVVLAFLTFLAVGTVVILVFASQPVSNPSIQSGPDTPTSPPHPRATTSSMPPGTLPQPPIEVEAESATAGATGPAATTAPPTTATPSATPLMAAPPSAAALTAAAPTTVPPAALPPATAPPAAPPTTRTAPTTAPPTTAPHTPDEEKPIPPGQGKK
jgi:hypothetical protein